MGRRKGGKKKKNNKQRKGGANSQMGTSNGICLSLTKAVSRLETSSGKQAKLMTEALKLPVIDLSSQDRLSTAKSIRQVIIIIIII